MLSTPRLLRFEGFQFDALTRKLVRLSDDGAQTPISLGSRAADLLLLFLTRPGDLVTKNEIMDAVWPQAAVEDSNLTVQISALRRALDAGRNGPSAIQTVPGRGYRFTLHVNAGEQAVPPAPGAFTDAQTASPDETAEQPPQAGLSSRTGADSPTPAPLRTAQAATRSFLGLAAMAALLCAAALVVHWRGNSGNGPVDRAASRSAQRPATMPAAAQLSIVVLPIANSTGEARNDALAVRLSEDITAGLTQIAGAFVVARSVAQAAAARGLSLPAIGSTLGVRYALEGSVRQAPGGVELNVQLSDTARGASIWAAQFKTGAEGADAAAPILEDLMFPLTTAFMDAEARRLADLPAAAMTADDLLLQVRATQNHQPVSPARNAKSIAALERAMLLQPDSAAVTIGLANEIMQSMQYDDPDIDRQELMVRVHSLADRARVLAGGSEAVLALQARILRADGRCDEAITAYAALMQAHPATVAYYQGRALCLMARGQSDEALPLLEQAVKFGHGAVAQFRLDANLGRALIRLGRNAEAIRWLRLAREHSSTFNLQVARLLAIAYANSGNTEAARREFAEFAKRLTPRTVRNLRHIVWGRAAEEMKREIDGLAIAGMRDHVDEDAETGLPISTGLRSGNLNGPTPLGAPGVSVIHTSELSALIVRQEGTAAEASPLILSTVSTCCINIAFPQAIPVPTKFFHVPLSDDEQRSLKTWVDGLLGGNPTRRLMTLSWSAEWWQSRNLAIELAALGYPNVSWYRGGLEAWDLAGLPVALGGNRAILTYEEEIRREPQSAAAFYGRGDAYRAAGDLDRAIADYDEALRLDPTLPRAYLNRGRAYGLKHDLDHAIADYGEAIRLDPRMAEAFNNRGFAYRGKGDPDRAIADYSEAIRLDPQFAVAFENRGEGYATKGDLDHAIADYNEAIRLNPKYAFAIANRGGAYLAKGDADRAIADYDVAIRLNPKLAFAFDSRGRAYAAKMDFAHAMADYDEAIRLAPKMADAYFGRGRIHLYGGAFGEAQAAFKQGIELAPKWPYPLLWLDITQRRSSLPGNLKLAAAQMDKAAWPGPLISLLLGELTLAQALAAVDDVDPSKKRGKVCETNFYSAELALIQNAREEAIRLFRLAADDCPIPFVEWEGARAELKALGVAP